MNLDELRSVQNTERQKDSLQHLRESFYEDVSAYVSELEGKRDRAAEDAEDPFASPDVRRLTDEIETAKEVTRAIYERRLGKLVKRASLAAADMPADEEGLTAEERELFSDLVERMEQNKSHVLDVVEGETDPVDLDVGADSTGSASDTPGDTREEVAPGDPPPREDLAPAEAAQVAGGESPPGDVAGDDAAGSVGDSPAGTDADDEGDPTDDERPASDGGGLDDRTTVKITSDVGEIFGVDKREYDLSAETVVALPDENAEPLLQRGAAERID